MSKDDNRPDVRHEHSLLDFPTGNGEPNCPKCKGRGVVPMMVDVGGGVMWPGGGTQNCDCMFKRDLLANVKRVWAVLLNVKSAKDSPLLSMTKQSLWLTASNFDFRQHLRFVAFRMGTRWDAKVISDASLATAWLSTCKVVFDGDVAAQRNFDNIELDRPSDHFQTIVDIAVPFDLLIIKLGVKAAKNVEMPGVLAEAISEREVRGLPTWVVDSHVKPITGEKHRCRSEDVLDKLDGFRRVVIEAVAPTVIAASAAQKYPASRSATTAAPVAASTGMDASNFTRRKPGMMVSKPQVTPSSFDSMPMDDGFGPEYKGPPPSDDEFDVDELLANAHDPNLVDRIAADQALIVEGAEDGGEAEVEDLLEDFPDASELGGNASQHPAWLRGALTKEERLRKERADRQAKRQKKKWGDDDS